MKPRAVGAYAHQTVSSRQALISRVARFRSKSPCRKASCSDECLSLNRRQGRVPVPAAVSFPDTHLNSGSMGTIVVPRGGPEPLWTDQPTAKLTPEVTEAPPPPNAACREYFPPLLGSTRFVSGLRNGRQQERVSPGVPARRIECPLSAVFLNVVRHKLPTNAGNQMPGARAERSKIRPRRQIVPKCLCRRRLTLRIR